MEMKAVGIVTKAYVGDGKDFGYVGFTDVLGGAALSLRASAADTKRLQPALGQTVELRCEFTVNQYGENLSLEMLELLGVKPVKFTLEAAPAAAAKAS